MTLYQGWPVSERKAYSILAFSLTLYQNFVWISVIGCWVFFNSNDMACSWFSWSFFLFFL